VEGGIMSYMGETTPEPRREAIEAARWWAQQLTAVPEDDLDVQELLDDPRSLGLLALSRSTVKPLTREEADQYAEALAVGIEQHLAQWGRWDPAKPHFGSALRSIGVDYGPERVLTDAVDAVGLKISRVAWPMKTVMWIDPGEVRVAVGERGGIETVWAA
jgi:BTG family protein